MADQLHDLADLPPEEFVAARDQLAKRLITGDREGLRRAVATHQNAGQALMAERPRRLAGT